MDDLWKAQWIAIAYLFSPSLVFEAYEQSPIQPDLFLSDEEREQMVKEVEGEI